MNTQYAILVHPSSNRVYNASSDKLAQAELQSFNVHVLNQSIHDVQNTTIAGVPYLTFSSPTLSQQSIGFLSNLSFLFALFKIELINDTECLIPITITPLRHHQSDLLTILKFSGKTNDQFTRMLLNVTIMASAYSHDMMRRKLCVLDPLCGRGTTLNQALMYGYHASGVEIDKTNFDAYNIFINRWLKDKRLKHKSESVVLRKNGKVHTHRMSIRLAKDKQAYKAGDVQHIDVLNSDTINSGEFLKSETFDLIVADLPYGVQHGNKSTQGTSKSPLALLQQAVPVWTRLLRHGGAMGLSWNTYLAKQNDVIAIIEAAGLKIDTQTAEQAFRHRVDQAINRDIVVACKI